MSNPFRRTVAAVAVAGLAGTGAFVGASPAQSVPVPGPDRECPEAFPLADLAAGQPVDGLTVSSGTVPDEFTGEVLGVLKDGIGVGLDMIIVRLTNDEIDRVGGIWAGMSGSPVYAADGRLIGAVSYGLASGSSPVAGVTPAADMQALLDEPVLGGAAANRVAMGKSLQKRVVASGAASTREAESGLSRLPVPVTVSGVTNKQRLAKVTKKLGLEGVSMYAGGAAPTTAAAAADEIFAGSNLAASLAYGDFSAVGTGTTTFVCDGQPVGFGHPFAFAGGTTMTLHGADAIYVQEESLGAPFKVANPTGPVGTIDQDRLAGIKGIFDVVPDTTQITTTVTSDDRSRTGETRVSVPDYTADATAFGFLANLDRIFDQIGEGSSEVSFTINGTADGEPFSVERSNKFSSGFDITYESIFEPADAVFSLLGYEGADVEITDVDIDADVEAAQRSFAVSKVEQKVKGSFVTLTKKSRITAKAGQTLRFRVTLTSAKNAFGSKTVNVSTTVPNKMAPGSRGRVYLGQNFGFYEEFFYEEGDVFGEASDKSIDDVISSIEDAPRNDELTATLELFNRRTDRFISQETTVPAGDVVTGQRSFRVRIR